MVKVELPAYDECLFGLKEYSSSCDSEFPCTNRVVEVK